MHTEDYLLCGHIIEKYAPSQVKEIKVKIQEGGETAYKGFFYAILPTNGLKKKDGVNVVKNQNQHEDNAAH